MDTKPCPAVAGGYVAELWHNVRASTCRSIRALLLYAVLLLGSDCGAATTVFRIQYPEAYQRLCAVYGNATFELRIRKGGSNTAAERCRILMRWPSVRIDRLGPSGSIISSSVFSSGTVFSVRALASDNNNNFVLTRFSRTSGQGDVHRLWMHALNEGWLPLVVIGWFEQPLVEYILGSKDVELTSEGVEQLGEARTYAVEVRQQLSEDRIVRGKFWFLPDAGWVLLRWRWPYRNPEANEGVVCDLSYESEVGGVRIVKAGRYVHLANGSVRWEAEVTAYELVSPPESAFRPTAFGIPEPSDRPAQGRLWLWALLGALGITTALVLLRLTALLRGQTGGPDM